MLGFSHVCVKITTQLVHFIGKYSNFKETNTRQRGFSPAGKPAFLLSSPSCGSTLAGLRISSIVFELIIMFCAIYTKVSLTSEMIIVNINDNKRSTKLLRLAGFTFINVNLLNENLTFMLSKKKLSDIFRQSITSARNRKAMLSLNLLSTYLFWPQACSVFLFICLFAWYIYLNHIVSICITALLKEVETRTWGWSWCRSTLKCHRRLIAAPTSLEILSQFSFIISFILVVKFKPLISVLVNKPLIRFEVRSIFIYRRLVEADVTLQQIRYKSDLAVCFCSHCH